MRLKLRDRKKLVAHLEPSDYQKSKARLRRKTFSIDYSCRSSKVLIVTLVEEVKPLVKEPYEFGYQGISKQFPASVFLDFGVKNKLIVLSIESYSRTVSLSTETLRKNSNFENKNTHECVN